MPDPRDMVDDPDAPVSEEERAEAERLRAALEDPSVPHADAELARALAASHNPRDLTPQHHRELVARALPRRRAVVIRVAFGASAVLAAAAVALLVLGGGPGGGSPSQPPSLAVSRSTQPLFPDPFARTGGETTRIDRIALARAADLRDNEFAKWGVR